MKNTELNRYLLFSRYLGNSLYLYNSIIYTSSLIGANIVILLQKTLYFTPKNGGFVTKSTFRPHICLFSDAFRYICSRLGLPRINIDW